MDILGFLKGNKTYMIVVGLLIYIAINAVNGSETDPNIVNALLGGGLWTLRLGIKNGDGKK